MKKITEKQRILLEKMKSQGIWYCPNSKCKRYGLCSVIILPAPKRLAKEKGKGR